MKRRFTVGGTLEEAGQRFVAAWRRAERGEAFEAEDNVTFVSMEALDAAVALGPECGAEPDRRDRESQ